MRGPGAWPAPRMAWSSGSRLPKAVKSAKPLLPKMPDVEGTVLLLDITEAGAGGVGAKQPVSSFAL